LIDKYLSEGIRSLAMIPCNYLARKDF